MQYLERNYYACLLTYKPDSTDIWSSVNINMIYNNLYISYIRLMCIVHRIYI